MNHVNKSKDLLIDTKLFSFIFFWNPPKIYKLGSGAWKKIKQKTKKRVKEIAYNLIKLYLNVNKKP